MFERLLEIIRESAINVVAVVVVVVVVAVVAGVVVVVVVAVVVAPRLFIWASFARNVEEL